MGAPEYPNKALSEFFLPFLSERNPPQLAFGPEEGPGKKC